MKAPESNWGKNNNTSYNAGHFASSIPSYNGDQNIIELIPNQTATVHLHVGVTIILWTGITEPYNNDAR